MYSVHCVHHYCTTLLLLSIKSSLSTLNSLTPSVVVTESFSFFSLYLHTIDKLILIHWTQPFTRAIVWNMSLDLHFRNLRHAVWCFLPSNLVWKIKKSYFYNWTSKFIQYCIRKCWLLNIKMYDYWLIMNSKCFDQDQHEHQSAQEISKSTSWIHF